MNRSTRRITQTLLVATVGIALLLAGSNRPATTDARASVLQASDSLKWYRGNLHTHSLWSDGDDYLEMIAAWYLDHDYDFLCFTDHNLLATNPDRWVDISKKPTGKDAYDKLKARFPDWVEERSIDGRTEVRLKTFREVSDKLSVPDEFLLIQGEEVSDGFNRLPIHMNVSNVLEALPPMHGESVADTIQNNVNALIAQRERTGQTMMIHLNHPNFQLAITAEDLMRVRGEKFFEVYNGHPGVRNSGDEQHASTERLWDIILTKRLAEFGLPVMYGIATDDGHSYHKIPSRASEPGRGWVMVLADSLKPETLITAMESGRFYGSSGVTMSRVESSPGGLKLAVHADDGVSYRIEFIGTRRGYDPESQPVLDKDGNEVRATRIYSSDIGTVLKTVEGTTAEYTFEGDEIYVRARVTSDRLHPNPSEIDDFEQAWVQPVVGPAAMAVE